MPSLKIPVKNIAIERLEGPKQYLGLKSFKDFTEASSWLRSMSRTYPDSDGYDKHLYAVTFEDGYTYAGRIDCSRTADLDVESHMLYVWSWKAGREASPWCGKAKYKMILSKYGEAEVARFRGLLDRYFV